jgi:hypothetical protein
VEEGEGGGVARHSDATVCVGQRFQTVVTDWD